MNENYKGKITKWLNGIKEKLELKNNLCLNSKIIITTKQ